MSDKSIIDEFKNKIDRPLKAAFSKISDENHIRDMLISQQQEKIQKLESQMELLLSILRSQDEKLRDIREWIQEKGEKSPIKPLTFSQNESSSRQMVQKIQQISQKLDKFSKPLSPAQEWIVDQVKELQSIQKGGPVLSKIVQELFYADRPEIKAKRHAFYHHISKCVHSGFLGKLIAGNQMYLYIPKTVSREIRI